MISGNPGGDDVGHLSKLNLDLKGLFFGPSYGLWFEAIITFPQKRWSSWHMNDEASPPRIYTIASQELASSQTSWIYFGASFRRKPTNQPAVTWEGEMEGTMLGQCHVFELEKDMKSHLQLVLNLWSTGKGDFIFFNWLFILISSLSFSQIESWSSWHF